MECSRALEDREAPEGLGHEMPVTDLSPDWDCPEGEQVASVTDVKTLNQILTTKLYYEGGLLRKCRSGFNSVKMQ